MCTRVPTVHVPAHGTHGVGGVIEMVGMGAVQQPFHYSVCCPRLADGVRPTPGCLLMSRE